MNRRLIGVLVLLNLLVTVSFTSCKPSNDRPTDTSVPTADSAGTGSRPESSTAPTATLATQDDTFSASATSTEETSAAVPTETWPREGETSVTVYNGKIEPTEDISEDTPPAERSIDISSAQELLFFSPCSEETGAYYKMRVISDVQVIADYFDALHTASWQDPQGWEAASLDKEMVIISEKDKTHFFGYQGETDSFGNAYIRYYCQDGSLPVPGQDRFADSELRQWISEQFAGEAEEFILSPSDYRSSLAVLTEAP